MAAILKMRTIFEKSASFLAYILYIYKNMVHGILLPTSTELWHALDIATISQYNGISELLLVHRIRVVSVGEQIILYALRKIMG